MWTQGRAESWIIHSIPGYDEQPYLTAAEATPAVTWRLILAAQQNNAVTSYFMQRLLGEEQSTVDPDECTDEFKVMATQMKYLSVADEVDSEVPRGILFYKKSRIVAPPSIRAKLMAEAHGTGHTGITKMYNQLRAIWWWPNLYTDMKKMVVTLMIIIMYISDDQKDQEDDQKVIKDEREGSTGTNNRQTPFLEPSLRSSAIHEKL